MRYRISSCCGRRLHLVLQKGMLTEREADILYYALMDREDVEKVQVFPRCGEVTMKTLTDDIEPILVYLDGLRLDETSGVKVPGVSARSTNEFFRDKIIDKVVLRILKKSLLPVGIQQIVTVVEGAPFIWHGIKDIFGRKFSAEIVHASAISASLLTADFPTASSITFLTEIGEILEEWTYKKSVNDLAQSLALNITKVWKQDEAGGHLVDIEDIVEGDLIKVTMGNMIPLDGVVTQGEALVNQAALTGESMAVRKIPDRSVYAGTVVEEGEIVFSVKSASGQTRYDKIIQMIEASESMQPAVQGQAEKVVSKMIPYTFGTAVAVWLLTRNVTKAASVLMVDFSCAIEVAMPVATLSAMSEASRKHLTVKGGKFLESIAEADTIVFDKTGTLTKATPCVEIVMPMGDRDENEMLRIAACLEEHFPHSLANAVVRLAKERNLEHDEMHSKPEYIIARGVAATIGGRRAVIGSRQFVVEDENVTITDDDAARIRTIPQEYSRLYLAIGGELAACIGISDPIKEGSVKVISELKEAGIENVVMMTGDGYATAKAIADKAGITEVYAQVLPEDKANYVEKQKQLGRKVIMVGDGINDSPALSAA
ncbi:MAG: heavy metal translocating P-type ATPase, partial [Eubacteriaceae bacterium]|nr:heavy metal translocating P-type ATPase [Eubacteriaceae bacterium]